MITKTFAWLLVIFCLTHGFIAEAQQPKKNWRVGIFHVGMDHVPPSLEQMRRELRKLGYEEGKNIQTEWHNLPDEEAAHKTAKEFVQNKVDLIVAYENQTVRAAQTATSEIPIIFVAVTDPVAQGFVKSWAHPGGNITGFATWGELDGKQIGLFKEMVPGMRRLLVLIDRADPGTEPALADIRKTSSAVKLQLVEREVTKEADVEGLFRSLKRGDVDGVCIASPSLRSRIPAVITKLALQARLPLAMHRDEWVEKGALFSYGFIPGQYASQGAIYIDKIFNGTKVGDLPVQQPPEIRFVINLKTAKQLGLTIPQSVLFRADRVIR